MLPAPILLAVAGLSLAAVTTAPGGGQPAPPSHSVPHRSGRRAPFVAPQNVPTLLPPPVLGPIAPNPPMPPVVGPTQLVPLPYPEPAQPPPASLPSGFVMTVAKNRNGSERADRSSAIDAPQQVPQRLAACWKVPADVPGNAGITVRLAFSRQGAIAGKPRITYVQSGLTGTVRAALVKSMLSALAACTPLPFTPRLGSAIAGYPFAIRFVAANR